VRQCCIQHNLDPARVAHHQHAAALIQAGRIVGHHKQMPAPRQLDDSGGVCGGAGKQVQGVQPVGMVCQIAGGDYLRFQPGIFWTRKRANTLRRLLTQRLAAG
jgi:hypothetical protein